MLSQSKIKFWLMVVFLATSFCFSEKAAAATSTLRGAAWWGDTLGYLYVNCLDSVIGDRLDEEGNFRGDSIPPGFRFYSPPCTSINHRVQISENGNFSGYAWNSYKGLVAFEATTTPNNNIPDRAVLSTNCPSCFSDTNCWACYKESDQKVYGWARVTSDGSWINLNNSLLVPLQIKSWNEASSTNPVIGYKPGTFVGYASSTEINFNCLTDSSCALRSHEVYIENLQIGNLVAPQWNYNNACGAQGALVANFHWELKSGTRDITDNTAREQQIGYEIIISTSDSTSTPICFVPNYNSTADQAVIDIGNCPSITYAKDYYWWIRLKTDRGADTWTNWYQYNNNSTSDTDKNIDGNPKTFTTYKHEFPSPFFSWSPLYPEIGSSTEFISASSSQETVFYPIGNSPQACSTSTCLYAWWTNDTLATITASTSPTTTIFFQRATNTLVRLTVTDNRPEQYFCSAEKILKINFGLPIWREIKAEDF